MESHQPKRRVIGMRSLKGRTLDHCHRILVVDDHPENRALLQLLLEQVGFLVKTAENGREAVEFNEEWRPHLIWMDIRMPEMDGYEATRSIRRTMEDTTEGRPVIIALTASAFKEDRDAVLAAGCDDFVRRPFRESEIFNKIHEHLGVDYIYENVEEVSNGKAGGGELSAEALFSEILLLPSQVVKELRSAIELSDMEQMNQLAAVIGNDHEALASELNELIYTFQYDRILTLLDEAEGAKLENPGG